MPAACCSLLMIKNIYYVRVAKDDAEFAELERFFATLGLDKGTAWQGRHNKGVLFRTPQAGMDGDARARCASARGCAGALTPELALPAPRRVG